LVTSQDINRDDESCGKLLISYLVPERGLRQWKLSRHSKAKAAKKAVRGKFRRDRWEILGSGKTEMGIAL